MDDNEGNNATFIVILIYWMIVSCIPFNINSHDTGKQYDHRLASKPWELPGDEANHWFLHCVRNFSILHGWGIGVKWQGWSHPPSAYSMYKSGYFELIIMQHPYMEQYKSSQVHYWWVSTITCKKIIIIIFCHHCLKFKRHDCILLPYYLSCREKLVIFMEERKFLFSPMLGHSWAIWWWGYHTHLCCWQSQELYMVGVYNLAILYSCKVGSHYVTE